MAKKTSVEELVATRQQVELIAWEIQETLERRGVPITRDHCSAVVTVLLTQGLVLLPPSPEPDRPMTGQTTIDDHV